MKKIVILGCIAAAIFSASCSKEMSDNTVGNRFTLSLSFEDQTPSVPSGTKTYLNSSKQILWGSSQADHTLYVFDSDDAKYTFTSSASDVNATSREFSKDGLPGGFDASYAIWTGKAHSQTDNCTISGGIFSGSTLQLLSTQDIMNSNSFAQTANIAVMKKGDTALRNVFGYIQFVVPADGESHALIKSVAFTADENLAGVVTINYSGSDPVSTIVSSASKTITVNMRDKEGYYEPGTLYAVLPAGTYHNFKITITPVAGDPFILKAKSDVVVVRGKYTAAGELPYVDPNAGGGGGVSKWPNDDDAFDYGLSKDVPKTADPKYDSLTDGVEFADDVKYTVDKVTYCGKGTYKTDRWMIQTCYSFKSGSGGVLPNNRYISFKINRPGTLQFFPRHNAGDKHPVIVVTVVMNKGGVESFHNLYSEAPANISANNGDKTNPTYILSIPISGTVLDGIDEAATVYIFHKTGESTTNIFYYPLTWTPSE